MLIVVWSCSSSFYESYELSWAWIGWKNNHQPTWKSALFVGKSMAFTPFHSFPLFKINTTPSYSFPYPPTPCQFPLSSIPPTLSHYFLLLATFHSFPLYSIPPYSYIQQIISTHPIPLFLTPFHSFPFYTCNIPKKRARQVRLPTSCLFIVTSIDHFALLGKWCASADCYCICPFRGLLERAWRPCFILFMGYCKKRIWKKLCVFDRMKMGLLGKQFFDFGRLGKFLFREVCFDVKN